MINNTDLIDLQNAHVTQITNEKVGKSVWKVRKNITSEDLFELPAHLSEPDVFEIMDFAKQFELIALNTGINFQRGESAKVLQKTIQGFENQIKIAREENSRLANKLGQLIGEQEE